MAKDDEQIWDGVWFHTARSWRLVCCDCSLAHDVDHRLVKLPSGRIRIETKMTRHPLATAARRRIFKFEKEDG